VQLFAGGEVAELGEVAHAARVEREPEPRAEERVPGCEMAELGAFLLCRNPRGERGLAVYLRLVERQRGALISPYI